MAIHKIPIPRLSPEVLQSIIEEFISRDGTDYGEVEVPLEAKVAQVKHKLEKGAAVLVFDDEAESANIFAADDPILKSIEELTE